MKPKRQIKEDPNLKRYTLPPVRRDTPQETRTKQQLIDEFLAVRAAKQAEGAKK